MGVDREPRFLGRAFGLGLDFGFECPGLPPGTPTATGPTVRIELTDQVLESAFPSDGERLWELRSPEGELVAHFDADASAGYLLTATGYGTFLVAPDARHVRCAPASGPAWMWQRYLVGQVLPFVAVLHELEVFHASVMMHRRTVVAFLGSSGSGKSTLAAILALRGARYVTDDVMAVDARGPSEQPEIRAHPGFGLASLRRDLAGRLDPGVLERLGRRIGEDDDAVRLAVDVVEEPVPIGCAFFLLRGNERAANTIEACAPVDPRLLLASSYNFVLRDADRLTRQLDVCARMARTVPLFRLTIAPDVGPFEIAELVDEHVATMPTLL